MPKEREPSKGCTIERSATNPSGFLRKSFAVSAALVMILLGFSIVGQTARAGNLEPVGSAESTAVGVTEYGPGLAITPLADGEIRIQYLPTFQRWDGAWRPTAGLDRPSGEWPYLVEESLGEIRVTRLGHTFTQAKPTNSLYEYQPDGVKETIVLYAPPDLGRISIPFTSSLSLRVEGDRAYLRDANGRDAWTTTAWHAWDSSEPVQQWDRPVSRLEYANGALTVQLDEVMLARVTYPLYVDPAWVTSAALGWPSITTTDVFEDLGDLQLRIGWFADNFNDGVKDGLWLTDMGTWWISNGAAQLNLSTLIRTTPQAGVGKWDSKIQAKITITATGSGTQLAKMLFRWESPTTYHVVEINEKTNLVTLRKVVSGSPTTLCSGTPQDGVATNTPYVVKVDSTGGSHAVTWVGATLCSATDPSPPSPSLNSFGFETSGTKIKIAVDDVRAWTTDLGYVTTDVRAATPGELRSIHTGSAYNGVDLRILSSQDNVTWGGPHYVKSGAMSHASDSDAYQIQDADRRPFYRARVDLRSTDDYSPAVSEIAVIEGGTLVSQPYLGYEPWQYYIGGMVEASGGNLFLQMSDFSLQGKGWPLQFVRSYNGKNFSANSLGAQGWTHSYNVYLTTGGLPGTLAFHDGDGTLHLFEDAGGGLYSSPRGLSAAKLVRNGDNTYTLAWGDGSRWTFSPAGKLTEMKDRNANKITLTYDGNGRLAKVADDSGIFLVFAYDGSGRVIRVGDHNVTATQRNATTHSGSWSNGANAFTSNNAYATENTASDTHRYSGYGFSGPSSAWITKVEACVEAHTAGDDDIGVKVSTNGGSGWSAEQVVNLPSSDPNALTCLDFTSHLGSWTWSNLNDSNLRVEVRYLKVGGQAATNSLDWIPIRVSSASRFWSYAYDGTGHLSSATDPLGASELYSYGLSMTRYVDRADRVLDFTVVLFAGVTEVWTGKYNRTLATTEWKFRQYAIDSTSQNQKTFVTDALGNVTTIDRTFVGVHPKKIDGPLAASGVGCSCCGAQAGEVWSIEWDGEFNWFSRADGKGQKTFVTHDWRANQVRETDALGNYTENTWQNRDNSTAFDSLLLKQRNRRGFSSTNEYDWEGNLVKTTDALGNFTRTFHLADGFVNRTTDKRGFNTTYAYDSHGWLQTATDPIGHATQYRQDAVGRPVNTTSALGFTSRRAYNANDWVVSEINPLGFVTTFAYDDRGDLVAVVDPNGNTTSYVHNVTWAKVVKMTDATGATTEDSLDKLGRLVQVKDPRGQLWKYEYDKFGRTTKEIEPGGNDTRFSYDAAGNLVQRIDANGKYTNFTLFDALNRIKTVSYQDGNVLTYAYDANSNAVSETGYGFTRTTEYDALDRVKKVTFNFGSFSKIVQYTYDQESNRKTMIYPDGYTVTYVWDAAGRLTGIQTSDGTWTLIYDEDDRRTATRHPNGLELNANYDSGSRLTSIATKYTSNQTVMQGFSYTYDKVSNRKTTTDMVNGTTIQFGYNEEYALDRTTYETGSSVSYAYDQSDNRLRRNESDGEKKEYFYNLDSSMRKVTTQPPSGPWQNTTYTYDGNGNLKQKTGSPTQTYLYDLENRLTQVTVDNVTQATYAYFSDGSRMRRTESAVITHFMYDFRDLSGFNDIIEEYDSAGAVRARYIHGPGADEPLAQQYLGGWYYYHLDGLGSITLITDSAKMIKNSYLYDDFGAFRSRSEAIPNSYAFTSREEDLASYYYRARFYDSEAGRFLSRDPLGMAQGANRYAYAANNPQSLLDPRGTEHLDVYTRGGSPYHYFAPHRSTGETAYHLQQALAYWYFGREIDWYCVAGTMGKECGCLLLFMLVGKYPATAGAWGYYCLEYSPPGFCTVCSFPCWIAINEGGAWATLACALCLWFAFTDVVDRCRV